MTERTKSVCFSSLLLNQRRRDTGKKCPGGGGTPMAPDLTGDAAVHRSRLRRCLCVCGVTAFAAFAAAFAFAFAALPAATARVRPQSR